MDLRDLKNIWHENGFKPSKIFGQNFLIDKNIRDKIFNIIAIPPDSTVLEIGPGFGVMTFTLAGLCSKIIAVEKDSKVVDIMTEYLSNIPNLELVNKDILDIDLKDFSGKDGKILVYGNIPYSITTPIVSKIIENRDVVSRAYLVMQDEVARRLTAAPGTKDYGSISCFVQFHAKVRCEFKIKRNSFYPTPKVDSSLLSMCLLEKPPVRVRDKDLMFRVIRQAFSQRRKQVLNPLSHKGFLDLDKEAWRKILDVSGVDPSRRAEDIAMAEYAQIADNISPFLC